MRYTLIALAAAAAFMTTSTRADVVSTFDATGVFDDGSRLGGTLMIDLTTGSISGSNLTTTGPSAFSFVNIVNQSNTQVPGDYNVGDRNAASTEDFNFDLLDTSQMPLFNYNGGSICSVSATCVNGRASNLFNLTTNSGGTSLISGSLNPVPEPAAMTLLASGLLALGLAKGRRAIG